MSRITPEATPETEYIVDVKCGLNLRAVPDGDVMCALPFGCKVRGTDAGDGWVELRGFVKAEYLKPAEGGEA